MEGLETVIHESAFVDLKRHQTKQSRKVTQGRATKQSVTAWITELHYQKIPPQLLIFSSTKVYSNIFVSTYAGN